MSKPNSNSVLDSLPKNQQAQLEEWLFDENISYKEASKRCGEILQISPAPAPSALSGWYQRVAQRRMMDRIAASRSNANLVVDQLKKNPAKTYEALTGMIAQMAFEQSMKGEKMDLAMLTDLSNLTLSNRSLDLKEKEISLKRDRFEFDATKAALKQLPALRKIAADNLLSETDKLTKARQLLFGELPE